ncbi:MAG: hypothetical protein JNL19_06260 [Burkholderiales bacterium]|nr:hypothetical protein [Burkholderiales bacterium]
MRHSAADAARQRAAQPRAQKQLSQVVDEARSRLTALEGIETTARNLMQSLNNERRAVGDLRIPTIVAPRALVGIVILAARLHQDYGGSEAW